MSEYIKHELKTSIITIFLIVVFKQQTSPVYDIYTKHGKCIGPILLLYNFTYFIIILLFYCHALFSSIYRTGNLPKKIRSSFKLFKLFRLFRRPRRVK